MNIIQSLLIVFLVFCSTTVLLVTISTFIMLYDDIKYKYGYYEEEEEAIERAVELGWREKT